MCRVGLGAWYYLGTAGAMVKGIQADGGKWYYLGPDGKIATEPVMLIPGMTGRYSIRGLGD